SVAQRGFSFTFLSDSTRLIKRTRILDVQDVMDRLSLVLRVVVIRPRDQIADVVTKIGRTVFRGERVVNPFRNIGLVHVRLKVAPDVGIVLPSVNLEMLVDSVA